MKSNRTLVTILLIGVLFSVLVSSCFEKTCGEKCEDEFEECLGDVDPNEYGFNEENPCSYNDWNLWDEETRDAAERYCNCRFERVECREDCD